MKLLLSYTTAYMPFFFCSCIVRRKGFCSAFWREKKNVGFCENLVLFKVLDQASDSFEHVEIMTITKERDIMLTWALECFDGMVVSSVAKSVCLDFISTNSLVQGSLLCFIYIASYCLQSVVRVQMHCWSTSISHFFLAMVGGR